MDASTKDLLVKVGLGAGVLVVAGLGVVKVVQAVSGPPGGGCDSPSSPCFQSIQPYVQQYNSCATEYASYMKQFLEEDSKNGTGFTQAQLDLLSQLEQCMSDAATGIGQAAKPYGVNAIDVIATYAGEGIFAAAALYGAGKLISSLRTTPYTGAGAAASLRNAMIEFKSQVGELTSSAASAISASLSSLTNNSISDDGALLSEYAAQDIIALADVSALEAEDAAALAADQVAVEDALSAVLAYPRGECGGCPKNLVRRMPQSYLY